MPDDETVLHLCATRGCGGLVDAPEAPCPRCGRVPDDSTPADVGHDMRAALEDIRRTVRAVEWEQDPEPEPKLDGEE